MCKFTCDYRSLSEHCPSHTQSFVHRIPILTHLQDVHRLRQVQEVSCTQCFDTSGIVVHTGRYDPPEVTIHPHLVGEGIVYCATRLLFQILAWRVARLMCCVKASAVGGMFSIARFFLVNNTRLQSLMF